MARLSETQSTILSAAAARESRNLLPTPKGLKTTGKVLDRTLAALLRRGLAAETEVNDTDAAWRRDENSAAVGLRITDAGLTAIGAEIEAAGTSGAQVEALRAGDPDTSVAHPRGKLGDILAAVGAEGGATIAELAALAGWQPHTTRAALTRLRQRGFDIRLEQAGERKAYKLHATG